MGKRSRGGGRVHRQRRSAALAERVRRVGPEHFGILAVDSAKCRFAVLLADFYGRVVMDVPAVDNTGPALEALVGEVKAHCERHGLKDLVVAIEQTGRYHMPIRQVLEKHWDVQMVHPFATKQLREPADPGTKTDPTDLAAIVRAVVVGYGRPEEQLPPGWADWRLVSREREALVRQRAWARVRIDDRVEALLPGYPALWSGLWSSLVPLALAQRYGSAQALSSAGEEGIVECLHAAGTFAQRKTVARVLQWAAEAPPADPCARTAHALLCDQIELLAPPDARIAAYECDLAEHLVDTPFVLLMSIPGINVVSIATYGAELGPIGHYLRPTKITGRAGIYPSRYQSDETDLADGPLVSQRNARLRDAIMEIANNLLHNNEYFKAWGDLRRKRGWPEKKLRVAIACKFARISYWMLAGQRVFQHPCIGRRDAILRKLLAFLHEHDVPPQRAGGLLSRAARQLPAGVRHDEARDLANDIPRRSRASRGGPPVLLGEVLREVIAELAPGLCIETERSQTRQPHPPEEGPSLRAPER